MAIQVDPDALAQIIDAARPTEAYMQRMVDAVAQRGQHSAGAPKAPKFISCDPEEFLIWREAFLAATSIHDWDDSRLRQEARAAMQGQALAAVKDIPTNHQRPCQPVDQLLDLYQARFVTPAATDAARSNFDQVRQRPGETVNLWALRVRTAFARAHPEVPEDQINQQAALKTRFIQGMSNHAMGLDVWKTRPADFDAALDMATHLVNQPLFEKGLKNSISSIEEPSKEDDATDAQITAIQDPNMECYFCHKKGHAQRDCNLLNRARKLIGGRGGKGGGSGASGRGRGGSSSGRGSGGRGGSKGKIGKGYTKGPSGRRFKNPQLAAMDAYLHEHSEKETDEAAESDKGSKEEGDGVDPGNY